MYKPRVYTASKLPRFQQWIDLRSDPDWAFVKWTASWPDKVAAGLEEVSSPAHFAIHWQQDIHEVRESDFVLIYQDEGLRGALVEVGACIAFGNHVIAVGIPTSHSWSFHRSVHRCADLVEARTYLYQFTVMVPPATAKRKRDDQETD